ncbi:uncharacterized protein MELLADRAFT_110417 [Melampsora larici-populina 98AG31]|uniref:Uncharacterized protein n=1 Tax=Melampsora larici-populina (strain 98AG31 / pathotype 3-4-7) TaxID=747676 RepID=F4RZR4_MELLP|nr:uncharacterized protein MELLADRAFT_110417 [Melampsora larici-populina 98AG31]EGG02048.1 hypothetical protein MELLADRAFT_110417 [Melampsora larici-populina 98AG31]
MDHLTSSISSYSNVRATDRKSNSKPSKSHEKLTKLISRPFSFFRREIIKKNSEAHERSAEGGKTTAAEDTLPLSRLGESIDDQTQGDSEHDLLPSQSNSRPLTNYSIIHNSIITQSQEGYHSASSLDILKDPKRFIHGLTHLSILNFEIVSSSSRSGEVVNSPWDENSLESGKQVQKLFKTDSDGESQVLCNDEEIEQSSSSRRISTSSPKHQSQSFEPSSLEPISQDNLIKTDDKSKSKEYKFKRSNDSEPYREPVYEDKSTWIASNMLQALWNLLEGDEPHKYKTQLFAHNPVRKIGVESNQMSQIGQQANLTNSLLEKETSSGLTVRD